MTNKVHSKTATCANDKIGVTIKSFTTLSLPIYLSVVIAVQMAMICFACARNDAILIGFVALFLAGDDAGQPRWLGKRFSLVKKSLEMSVANLNMSEVISQILVSTEEVAEIKQTKGSEQ